MKEDGQPSILNTFTHDTQYSTQYEERCEDLKPRRSSPSLE